MKRIQKVIFFMGLLGLYLFPKAGFSQFSDNFSGNTLSSSWLGDTSSFKLTSSTAIPEKMRPALQLYDTASGTASLFTQVSSPTSDSLQWTFWVKFSFSPSANNYARFYLMAENTLYSDTTSGLFVSIGEFSKKISLYRKTKDSVTLLVEGPIMNKTTNSARIQIQKNKQHVFDFKVDSTGNHSFISYGKAIVSLPFGKSWYLGIFNKYTKSNSSKIYWDDMALEVPVKDTISPFIVSHEIHLPNTIRLVFSEQPDSISANSENTYQLNSPHEIMYIQSEGNTVDLTWYPDFTPLFSYVLTVRGIQDLNGNLMPEKEIFFRIPSEIEEPAYTLKKGDLLISEVLFNPSSGAASFIELYNNTSLEINLNDAYLATQDTHTQGISNTTTLGKDHFIKPNDYVVITTNKRYLENTYLGIYPEKCIEVKKIPSLGRKEGTILVTNAQGKTIDRFDYHEKMHFSLLRTKQGVSLERKSFAISANESNNWQSASESTGWGTPTYKNSQQTSSIHTEDIFSIDPPFFSPNSEGEDRLLSISYRLSETGWLCRIQIFDAKGRIMKHLKQNEWMGTEGTFTWDGKMNNNQMAPTGNYIVFIELFNAKGDIIRRKKAVTLLQM